MSTFHPSFPVSSGMYWMSWSWSPVVGDVLDHLLDVARGVREHDHVELHGVEPGVDGGFDPSSTRS